MKNLLLMVHEDEGQEARFQAALDLARALNGHITCFDIERIPVLMNDYVTNAGDVRFGYDEHDRSKRNRDMLEPRLKSEGVRWDWVHKFGDVANQLCNMIGLADIVVLNTDFKTALMPDMHQTVAATAIKTGRPILAVPQNASGFPVGGVAIVAWDGSPPAIAALRAAVPVLGFARAVYIVAVDETENASVAAKDGAAYLSRHGIHAAIRQENTHGVANISERILDISDQMKADYVVMGAYGHSRFTEAVLGGVTRSMLMCSPVPLILAH
jgi:nucleotide-binding universal stress UspA family protein